MKESLMRKKQSESILHGLGIPINPALPTIEEEDIRLRTKEEIIKRILALTLVSAKAMGATKRELDEFIQFYGIPDLFSLEEQNFMDSLQPNQKDIIKFSWHIEAVTLLLWSLNLVSKMNDPINACEESLVFATVLNKPKSELDSKASLKTKNEILDYLDLIYRMHWAIREAHIHNQNMPGGLNRSVVMERHYALNWLVHYREQQWDDITTDT